MSRDRTFKTGDKVIVALDPDIFKQMQENYVGWDDDMAQTLNQVGTITSAADGIVVVEYATGRAWTFNPDVLSHFQGVQDSIVSGDKVRIYESESYIQEQQQDHGGWTGQMKTIPGKVGLVERTCPNGDVRVTVLGNTWTLNRTLLTKLPQDARDDSQGYKVGENVRIDTDEEKVKRLQENHGEWVDQMRMCLGRYGTVEQVYSSGDLRVKVRGMVWTFNPVAVERVSSIPSNAFIETCIGDKVRVSSNETMVKLKQVGHGDYVSSMKNILGKVGVVQSIFPTGDLKVAILGNTWILNPEIVVKVTDDVSENGNAMESDLVRMMSEISKLAISSSDGSIFAAAAQGNVAQVKRLLNEGKNVDEVFNGHTALHIASHNGHIEVIRVLLQHKASLISEDEDGDTPLHIGAYGNEPDVCKFLINMGADPSTRNRKAQTPLNIASYKGLAQVVKVLLESNADVNAQDSYGDTPLHDAIRESHIDVARLLLNAGARIDIRNERGLNPFHYAAVKGSAEALEILIEHYKNKDIAYRVDEKKEDGFTALHLAAINNNVEAVQMLIMLGQVDINSQNSQLQTPLHVAVNREHLESVKVLVHAGCDMNIGDKDGDTALHECLTRVSLKKLKSTPSFGTVLEALGVQNNSDDLQYTEKIDQVAVFLAQNGADITFNNYSGRTPLDMCLDEEMVARVVSAAGDFTPRSSTAQSRTEPERQANRQSAIPPQAQVHINIQPEQTDNASSAVEQKDDTSNPWWKELKRMSKELNKLTEEKLCPICMERNSNMVFGCGHATCVECAEEIVDCPICRSNIDTRIKTFFP